MVVIRQARHLSGAKLTEASANVLKYPDPNGKVLIKIFSWVSRCLSPPPNCMTWAEHVSSLCVHTSVKNNVLNVRETCKP